MGGRDDARRSRTRRALVTEAKPRGRDIMAILAPYAEAPTQAVKTARKRSLKAAEQSPRKGERAN